MRHPKSPQRKNMQTPVIFQSRQLVLRDNDASRSVPNDSLLTLGSVLIVSNPANATDADILTIRVPGIIVTAAKLQLHDANC